MLTSKIKILICRPPEGDKKGSMWLCLEYLVSKFVVVLGMAAKCDYL